MTPAFQLCYTNPYGERFYLAELGDTWPHRPGVRFIQRTTQDAAEAMVFDAEEDAAHCLAHKMAAPPGWEVVGGEARAERRTLAVSRAHSKNKHRSERTQNERTRTDCERWL